MAGRKVKVYVGPSSMSASFVDGESYHGGTLVCDVVESDSGELLLRPTRGGLAADAVDMLTKERDELRLQISKLEGALEQQDKELARIQAERDDHLSTALRLTKVLLAKEES